jgi:hypothetical protein
MLFRPPPKGPRGGLGWSQGASGGARVPLPGGDAPGGALVAALPTEKTARLEPPPRGAPPGGPPGGPPGPPRGPPRGGPPRGPFGGGRNNIGAKKKKRKIKKRKKGGAGGPPKSALGALPAGGPKKGPILGLCGCFYPSCAVDRTMSLRVVVSRLFCFSKLTLSPRRLSGERPQLGDGVSKLDLGGPPGGPRVRPVIEPLFVLKNTENQALGGVPGGPLGGPRGGLCGAQGASGGVRGPLPGGYPPGGAGVGGGPPAPTYIPF